MNEAVAIVKPEDCTAAVQAGSREGKAMSPRGNPKAEY